MALAVMKAIGVLASPGKALRRANVSIPSIPGILTIQENEIRLQLRHPFDSAALAEIYEAADLNRRSSASKISTHIIAS